MADKAGFRSFQLIQGEVARGCDEKISSLKAFPNPSAQRREGQMMDWMGKKIEEWSKERRASDL
jgi:hypothetical protein